MKISVIGAGNVGATTALRLIQEGFSEIELVDIAKGMACGKAMDIQDSRSTLGLNFSINGSEEIKRIKGSDIVIVTAGLARKPGMSREELLGKNAAILKDVCLNIKELAPLSVLIVVTNPLDLMTYYALKITGFKPSRVLGMGVSLDAARFANLIAGELNLPVTDIEPCVIGPHGEGMLPLARFTKVKGVALDEFIDDKKVEALVSRTVGRGLEIVSLLASGSAYFAPSAAIAGIARVIAKDEKRVIGVSAYLNGEYGIKDLCIGAPCRLGKEGIEQIIELQLSQEEKEKLFSSAESLKKLIAQLPL